MGRSSGSVRTRTREGRKSTTQNRPDATSARASRSIFREYGEALLVAGIAALLIKTFLIQAYRIPSGSMEDSLLIGDFLLVNKFMYGAQIPFTDMRLPAIRDPAPGDVIVFQYPRDPTKDYIKRCVAIEGQTIEIRDKMVYIDGQPQPLPPKGKHIDPDILPVSITPRDNWGPYTVPPGHLFMMGDNRDNSTDSRFWGALDRRLIRGQAFILYMSWDFQPGDPELIWTMAAPVQSLFSLVYVVGYDLVYAPWRIRWGRIGMLID